MLGFDVDTLPFVSSATGEKAKTLEALFQRLHASRPPCDDPYA